MACDLKMSQLRNAYKPKLHKKSPAVYLQLEIKMFFICLLERIRTFQYRCVKDKLLYYIYLHDMKDIIFQTHIDSQDISPFGSNRFFRQGNLGDL